jgi:branched-chain amino acid transport system substrate-binding protein
MSGRTPTRAHLLSRVRGRAAIAIMVMTVLFVVACGSRSAGPSRETIRIGVIADLSQQPGSVRGSRMRSTLDSAVSQINADGGISGRPLQIIYADPRDDPAEALAQVRRLVRQGQVDILYGGTLVSECSAVEELAGWVHVAYMMGSACGAKGVTASACNEYSLRLTPPGAVDDKAAIMALRAAMIASGFTGKADTRKLIAALETLGALGGCDAPS